MFKTTYRKIVGWTEKQHLMETDLEITSYREKVWELEQWWTVRCAKGLILNIGGAGSPIKSDISCDPLVPRDIKCIGEYLPFKHKAFDTILIYSVLDHCISDSLLMKSVYYVLRDDGRLLIIQTMWTVNDILQSIRRILHRKHPDPYHLRHYIGFRSLRKLLERCGFIIESFDIVYYSGSNIVFLNAMKTSSVESPKNIQI